MFYFYPFSFNLLQTFPLLFQPTLIVRFYPSLAQIRNKTYGFPGIQFSTRYQIFEFIFRCLLGNRYLYDRQQRILDAKTNYSIIIRLNHGRDFYCYLKPPSSLQNVCDRRKSNDFYVLTIQIDRDIIFGKDITSKVISRFLISSHLRIKV